MTVELPPINEDSWWAPSSGSDVTQNAFCVSSRKQDLELGSVHQQPLLHDCSDSMNLASLKSNKGNSDSLLTYILELQLNSLSADSQTVRCAALMVHKKKVHSR